MNTFEIIAIIWMATGLITVAFEKINSIIKKEPLEITCPKEAFAVFYFLFFAPIAWLHAGILHLYWWRKDYLYSKRMKRMCSYKYPKNK